MKLYHGTNIDFESIDLSMSNPYKDFGRGFYLTSIRSQASDMAIKRAKFYGGKPVIKTYEFDKNRLYDNTLKVRFFNGVSIEWAKFINNNRSRKRSFIHGFDIIVGPIADDGVAYLLDRFNDGLIQLEELARELEYKELNNQYYFGTEEAIKLLKEIR